MNDTTAIVGFGFILFVCAVNAAIIICNKHIRNTNKNSNNEYHKWLEKLAESSGCSPNDLDVYSNDYRKRIK